MEKQIYLDSAAGMGTYREVLDEIEKVSRLNYGNPSSQHILGEQAREIVEKSRERIAKEIGAKANEIIFTSGTTESNNMAIQGLAKANPGKKRIVISSIEHPSVMEIADNFKKKGYEIMKIGVDKEGILNIGELRSEINKNWEKILLVSVMHVNNVIGSVEPIEEIGEICRAKGVIFHTDAAQSFGKLKIDVVKAKIDMLSASAYKIGGPSGIGFLYVREGTKIEPLFYGGGQERGLRSGTENVPGIAGFAKAVEIAKKTDKTGVRKTRGKLIEGLEKIGGKINGAREKRIYNNINVSFSGVDSGVLVNYLSNKGIFVSSGSACDSKKEKEDYVLKAIGLSKKESDGAIRITLDEGIGKKEIARVLKEIKLGVEKFRI